MNVLLLFLDGVGLGEPDPERNPFVRFRSSDLGRLVPTLARVEPQVRFGEIGHVSSGIDANLNVAGLPQSGTGQASLFTGVNCAAIAGRHFGPFPHSSSRPVLAEHNIFSRAERLAPGSAAFVNAYPPRFFEVMSKRDRWTVTTRCCLDAGIRVRTLDDLAAGRALPADITGEGLTRAGFNAVPVTETVAASRLAAIARDHRLTVFEYFRTDKVGHSQSFEEARQVIDSLGRFFHSLLEEIEGTAVTLIVTSDHGNMEDLSHRTHTRNPVPLVAWGPAAYRFKGVTSILDVTPAILRVISETPGRP